MASLEQRDKHSYQITGNLDFSTVTDVLTRFNALKLDHDVSIDLSGLERTNSAGLALLLELLADARDQNRKIVFTGVPETLLDLAEMSNVKHLLVN